MKYLVLLLLAAVLLFGCSQQDRQPESSTLSAWARPGSAGMMTGAYLSYQNKLNLPDTLLSFQSSVASKVELHQSYITEDNLSGMRPINELILQPKEEIKLEPGSFHLMLLGLTKDLVQGDSLTLTVSFKQAGDSIYRIPILIQ